MAKKVKITSMPHKFSPRWYQEPLFDCIANGYLRGVAVWHRRAGKDKTLINIMGKEMFRRVGVYYYFFPTFKQGRMMLWEGIDGGQFRFMDHIPEDVRERTNDQEMRIHLKNGSVFQVVGTDNIDCYDDETEILTSEGWKYFKDTGDKEVVASLVQGRMMFVPIDRRVEYDYVGEMIHYKSKSVDMRTTPGHNYWVKSRKGGFRLLDIGHIKDCPDNYMVPAVSGWDGELPDSFTLPPVRISYTCGKGRVVNEARTRSFSPGDFAAFLGIFLSEGSTYHNIKKGDYKVCITQNDGETADEITELLGDMDLKFQRNGNNFVISNKALWSYCKQFGKCGDKFIPEEIKGWDQGLLRVLFDWLVKGDGSISKTGQVFYFSTSKRLMDDIQEVVLKLGYSCKIVEKEQRVSMIAGREVYPQNILYSVNIRTSRNHYFRNNKGSYLTSEMYSGKVYCVGVPSHVVMVRRNGMPLWCGNSIMGTNPVGCVFSEYSLQKPGGWDLVRPILADNGGWALFNSTPRGLNHLYEIYQMARREPDWFCELLTVDETGAITVEQIDKERRAGMPESLVQQEFYCDFTASSPDKLIDLGIIEDAAGRHLVEGSYRHAPKVLGVDPSRFGDDKFCWVKRQGLAAFDLEKHPCSGPDELDFVVSKLMFTIRAFNPDAVFVDDTGGYGSEVTYRLRRLGYPVIGVNFSKYASKRSRYANKRSEIYDNLKQWLISGGAIPDDLDLKKDLGVIPYTFDRQNRLKIMKKDKIKSELMRSPDAGDALAITFAQDIFARRDLDDHYPGGGSVSVGDYDVLNFHNNDGVAI